MTQWLVTAAGVIIVPGFASLLLVRKYGLTPGLVILSGMVIWVIATVVAAQNGRNIPIQPEIFGGQTIGHSQVGGLREMFWATFVLGPATLWVALAVMIGRASYNFAQRQGEQP